MDADLGASQQPVADLEPDLRTAVEAEQVRYRVAEIAVAEIAGEPVRHPERQLALRASAASSAAPPA